jgi:hypothetical protein
MQAGNEYEYEYGCPHQLSSGDVISIDALLYSDDVSSWLATSMAVVAPHVDYIILISY